MNFLQNFFFFLTKFRYFIGPAFLILNIILFEIFLSTKNQESLDHYFNKDTVNNTIKNDYIVDASTVHLRLEGLLTEITKTEKNIFLWKKPVITILEVFIKNFHYKNEIILFSIILFVIFSVLVYKTLTKYTPANFDLTDLVVTKKYVKRGFWHIFWTILIVGFQAIFWMLETFGRFAFGSDPIKAQRVVTKEGESFLTYLKQKRDKAAAWNFGLTRLFQYQIFKTKILSQSFESNLFKNFWIFFVFWFCSHIKATEGLFIPKIRQLANLWTAFVFHEIFVYFPRYFSALKEKEISILKNFAELGEKIEIGPYTIYFDFIFTDAYFSVIYMIFCHMIIHISVYLIITTLSWIIMATSLKLYQKLNLN